MCLLFFLPPHVALVFHAAGQASKHPARRVKKMEAGGWRRQYGTRSITQHLPVGSTYRPRVTGTGPLSQQPQQQLEQPRRGGAVLVVDSEQPAHLAHDQDQQSSNSSKLWVVASLPCHCRRVPRQGGTFPAPLPSEI